MWHTEMLLLVICLVACGDVPRAPKKLSAPVQPMPEAGIIDAAVSCEANSRPTGPLPASSDCINCAITNCFDSGAACVGDPFCQSCIGDVLMAGCSENALWKALLICLCDPTAGTPAICSETCRPECATR